MGATGHSSQAHRPIERLRLIAGVHEPDRTWDQRGLGSGSLPGAFLPLDLLWRIKDSCDDFYLDLLVPVEGGSPRQAACSQ